MTWRAVGRLRADGVAPTIAGWRSPMSDAATSGTQPSTSGMRRALGHRGLDTRLARTGAPAQPWLGTCLAARRAGAFVNVARDGGVHAFILDTVAGARVRRCGVGAS